LTKIGTATALYLCLGIAQKTAARNDYDKTIQETEAAYMKILESSQTLLKVLKRESHSLNQVAPRGN